MTEPERSTKHYSTVEELAEAIRNDKVHPELTIILEDDHIVGRVPENHILYLWYHYDLAITETPVRENVIYRGLKRVLRESPPDCEPPKMIEVFRFDRSYVDDLLLGGSDELRLTYE